MAGLIFIWPLIWLFYRHMNTFKLLQSAVSLILKQVYCPAVVFLLCFVANNSLLRLFKDCHLQMIDRAVIWKCSVMHSCRQEQLSVTACCVYIDKRSSWSIYLILLTHCCSQKNPQHLWGIPLAFHFLADWAALIFKRVACSAQFSFYQTDTSYQLSLIKQHTCVWWWSGAYKVTPQQQVRSIW